MKILPRGRCTREQFEAWICRNADRVRVDAFRIVPCACDDVNCHGWRLVPTRDTFPMLKASLPSDRAAAGRELQYVPVEEPA